MIPIAIEDARRRELKRKTPLRAQPRSKGNRAELAVITLLHRYGWTSARRNWQSGGQGGADIIEGPEGVSIECKHQEACRIWDWWEQCRTAARPTDMPLLAFKRNRSEWLACVPLDDLLELLRERADAS